MKIDSDSFFVDANVLVYAAVKDDPRHEPAKALPKVPNSGSLHISPQIVTEFYSVATNPWRVTRPYSPLEAIEFIEVLLGYEHVVILPIALLKGDEVRGPRVFDLQIAATMLAHGVTKLFTYDRADFTQLAGLEILEPAQ